MRRCDRLSKPMEYFIQRTKHKCKRCTRFFSNEAALNQYHCEPPIKNGKFPHYSKTISRANNMEKHLRSCETAFTLSISVWIHFIGEWTLNTWEINGRGGASGAPAEYAKYYKAPEIVESALKYTTLTFRKVFNNSNKKDILQWLKEVIHSMGPIIKGQTRANVEVVR